MCVTGKQRNRCKRQTHVSVSFSVMNELEGLSRGCKPSQSAHHSAMVRETAKAAMSLFQNRHPALRTVTTKGTVLSSSIFTHEEDLATEMKNDDKILATCVNLSKALKRDEIKEGKPPSTRLCLQSSSPAHPCFKLVSKNE